MKTYKIKYHHYVIMYDYAIIGGGVSGLNMYLELLKKTQNIVLLEKQSTFGGRIYQYEENNLSFPAGGARFNRNHKRVIKLLKKYHLLDFRKDRGIDSSIDFIDAKGEFGPKFNNKTGFHYIAKVIKAAKQTKNKDELRHYTFLEFAYLHLRKDEVDFLLKASGYSGQLKHMNMFDAYNLFTNGIRTDIPFYAGYFHLLVEEMVKELRNKGARLRSSANVNHVTQKEGHFDISYNSTLIHAERVVFCIPKPALLKFSLLHSVKPLIEKSLSCKQLCRIYAKFPESDIWFKDIGKTVTNNPLRYVIPMNKENGLIMISYTDDDHTNYWKKYTTQNQLKKQIANLVKQTFNKDVEMPEKVWVFHWDCGVGYWKKGVHSEKIAEYLANPIQNIYICGENYSLQQSWVEGALESCERVLQYI